MPAPYDAFGSDFFVAANPLAVDLSHASLSTNAGWTSLGCISSITPPSAQMDVIDVPICLNATTRAKKKLPGAYDAGQAAYTLFFEPGAYDEAISYLDGTVRPYRIKLGETGTSIKFMGFGQAVSAPELTENGYISVSVTIQVSGEPEEMTDPAS